MEDVETRALETFPEPPPEISRTSSYPCPLRLWETYVDETFVIMKKSEVSEFFTYKERAPHNSLGTKKKGASVFGLIDQTLTKSLLIGSSQS